MGGYVCSLFLLDYYFPMLDLIANITNQQRY